MADCTESKEETNRPHPPVIMKFDAPEESSENSANEEVEGQSCEENSTSSSFSDTKSTIKIHSPVLSASKFGSSFGISEFKKSSLFGGLNPSLLRPSQLGTVTTNSPSTSVPSFSLTNNPFIKTTDKSMNENGNKTSNDNNTNDNNDDDNNKDIKNLNDNNDDNIDKKNLNDKKISAPKFLPLLSNLKEHENNLNNSVTSNSAVSGFVFGQNFKERATVAKDDKKNDDDNDNKKNNDDNDDNNDNNKDNNELSKNNIVNNDDDNNDESNNEKKNNENGSSELMFSTAATTACRTTSRPGITLSQAAQEIEEANRANKRKYSEVTLLTGEEDEINVLQINNAKLFTFDKETSGWKERGRGPLRLNDRDDESRLVGRTIGTQRLMLNTKVWPGMTAELAGPKSLRLTAMDLLDDNKVPGDIRIFIVQAAPKEVDELHDLLIQRIKRAKERQPKKLATDDDDNV